MNTAPTIIFAADPFLLKAAQEAATRVGCTLVRATTIDELHALWEQTPLVMLDEQTLAECATSSLPRRSDVLVLTTAEPHTDSWPHAVALGATPVLILSAAANSLDAALAKATGEPDPGQGLVVAVLGGRGGAGATVLATALTLTAADQGRNATLLDCDPLGGGIDRVLGTDKGQVLGWSAIPAWGDRLNRIPLRHSWPTAGVYGPTVLSCDERVAELDPRAVESVISACRVDEGVVVCDLPRTADPATRTVLAYADLAVLVVPAESRACHSAARMVTRIKSQGTPVALVVRGPAPSGRSVRDVEADVGLPSLITMRPATGLEVALDVGAMAYRSSSPLARAARKVLSHADELRET
ncbi:MULTISPECIES: septum site-determining protein Ssd [unclassified Crossiella]|uniref:septum site-determining protein Ssd n=1 Tax=unclassified Crossiella TaxID=2620835 RepID=UPI001FFFD665|nr:MULTISPECIES: septum site-determining protein Ssd [unclassified Crossiella]MCK2240026.1 hypothetical protein [Crossiella sp. S99.2]MCK2252734.1 hypothetical protein [Crossiella sp. S99.1]